MEIIMANEKQFYVDRANQSRAACKKCREKCKAGELRIAKLTQSSFGDGKMKSWYHTKCIFEQFAKQRPSTQRVESPDDLDGWELLKYEDRKIIADAIEKNEKFISAKKYASKISPRKAKKASKEDVQDLSCSESAGEVENNDVLFREFRRFIVKLERASSNIKKVNLVKRMFDKGSDGTGFKGDITKWCSMLLPGVEKRIYNLQSKQIIKLFSRLFNIDLEIMSEHLKSSDLGDVIYNFFTINKAYKPAKRSNLTIDDVYKFLKSLSRLKKEENQLKHLQKFITRCTCSDLKVIIRLILHDIQTIKLGPKQILPAIHRDAYAIFQIYKDINLTLKHCLESSTEPSILLMAPFQPVQVEPCRSIDEAFQIFSHKFFAEIKQDGRRVQIHKQGSNFKCYSKNSKIILTNKIGNFRQLLIKAFSSAKDFIIDCEFVTEKIATKIELNEKICLYVFDCLYFNGQSLISKPLEERKRLLVEKMCEIPNKVMFSHCVLIREMKDIFPIVERAFQEKQEGLILKHARSTYESGTRWLKLDRNDLHMEHEIEAVDLTVLGFWHGSGRKTTKVVDVLLGCHDVKNKKYCTVTKVQVKQSLVKKLKVVEIDGKQSKVPDWLNCSKSMIPDFVAKNLRFQPLWTITGREYLLDSDIHTADGISVRYPRILKMKSGKNSLKPTLSHIRMCAKGISDYEDLDVTKKDKKGKRKLSESEIESMPLAKVLKLSKRDTSLKITEEVLAVPTQANILPGIFDKVKLLVENGGEAEFENELKDFIEYGGLIAEKSDDDVTHVLHLEDSVSSQNVVCSNAARHIIVEWITDSIMNKKLKDCKPYTVRLEPIESIN